MDEEWVREEVVLQKLREHCLKKMKPSKKKNKNRINVSNFIKLKADAGWLADLVLGILENNCLIASVFPGKYELWSTARTCGGE